MTGPLRLLADPPAGARQNIAFTAALVELHAEALVPDTLRVYRYRRSVLLGRHQLVGAAVDRAACARRGVELARRVTGGGAVYMAQGIIAWDLVLRRRGDEDPQDLSTLIGMAVAEMLADRGIAAQFRPPGDVLAAGAKISGSAGIFEGATILVQGTLVVHVDHAELTAVLRRQGGDAGGVVGALAEFPGGGRDLPMWCDALAKAIASATGRGVTSSRAAAIERERAAALFDDEIGTDAFVFGKDVIMATAAEPAA